MTHDEEQPADVGIVGRGRMGRALARAFADAGTTVHGPWGRGADAAGLPDAGTVLLCVPDDEIPSAAAAVRAGPLVGHCSGARALDVLGGREGFSLHPLMTVAGDGSDRFAGAWCAVAGTTPRALGVASSLARRIGLRTVEVRDDDRALYHAAASLAANHLTGVLDASEAMMRAAGVPREALAPLARAAVDAWAEHGGERSLTGPLRRGDTETVRRQRDAVAARLPELLPFWDALTARTSALAERARMRA